MDIGVTDVTSTPSYSGASAEVINPGGQLGKNEFLELLVTQMKSQDPLEPMDNTAMIAELAQFSALEQMQNLNTKFESMRQDNAMAMSYMLSGQNVELNFVDGTAAVKGVVERVAWLSGKPYLTVDGANYAMDNISGITRVEAVAEEE